MGLWKLWTLLALALDPTAALAQGQASTRDIASVNSLLTNYVESWRCGDAKRMFADADPNIHWVNVVGMHWAGKPQVLQAHDAYLKSISKGVPLTLEQVESVVPVGDDALVVVVRWAVGPYMTPTGFKAPAAKNRMTLVLRRDKSALQIAHVANVEVNGRAAASNPIKDQQAKPVPRPTSDFRR